MLRRGPHTSSTLLSQRRASDKQRAGSERVFPVRLELKRRRLGSSCFTFLHNCLRSTLSPPSLLKYNFVLVRNFHGFQLLSAAMAGWAFGCNQVMGDDLGVMVLSDVQRSSPRLNAGVYTGGRLGPLQIVAQYLKLHLYHQV